MLRYKSTETTKNNGAPIQVERVVGELHPYDPVRQGLEDGTLVKATFEYVDGSILTYEKVEAK